LIISNEWQRILWTMHARLVAGVLAGSAPLFALVASGMLGSCGGARFVVVDIDDASAFDARQHDAPAADGLFLDTGEPDGEGGDDSAAGDDAGLDASRTDVVPSPDGGPDAELDGTSGGDATADAQAVCGPGFACTPGVPQGWGGPLEVYRGAGVPPPCSASFFGPSFEGHEGLNAPPATCGCSCGAPQGVSCSPVRVSFTNGATCAAAPAECAAAMLLPDTCRTLSERSMCAAALVIDISAAAPVPSGGLCNATPTLALPVPTWSSNTRACVATGVPPTASCPAGSVCAPRPASPFASNLCISQAGDVLCPAGGYSSRFVSYAGLRDTRGCSPCTCGSASGAQCKDSITVFSSTDGSCSTGGVTYNLPISCAGVLQPGDFRLSAAFAGGGCAPSQTVSNGTAVPAQPVTFCCLP
jgi:hypothetical protein